MPSTSAFVASIIQNVVVATIVLTLFCVLRKKYERVYEPRLDAVRRKHAPPPQNPGKGFFSTWFNTTWKTTDAELISTAGLDATMYVKFFALCAKFFALTTVLGCLILIPINATGENTDLPTSNPAYVEGFESLSMAGIGIKSRRFWAHLILAYVFVFAFYYLALETYKFYQQHRFSYLTQQHLLGRELSLLQRDLPTRLQSHDALLAHWQQQCGAAAIADVFIGRDTGKLSEHIAEREKNVAALEHAYAVLAENQALPASNKKHNQRPMKATKMMCCGKQDAIQWHTNEIERLNQLITSEQNADHPLNSCAIISFNSAEAMVTAYHAGQSKFNCCPALTARTLKPAQEPRDMKYENLKYKTPQKSARRIVTAVLTGLLIFFWLIPITIAQGVANLTALGDAIGVDIAGVVPSAVRGIIEGLAPALIVIAFFALLPMILRAFSDKIQGVESESSIQKSVLSKFFLFQLINNFIGTLVGGSAFAKLNELINSPGSIPDFLGISIPQTATYFVTLVLLQALSIFPLAMLRIGAVVVDVLKRKYLAKTEREYAALDACPAPDYGTMYSAFLIVWVIGSCYQVVASIVLPFCALFFALGLVISKYQAMYCFVNIFETGGTFWPLVFTRMVAAMFVGNLTLVGVLGLKQVPAQAALAAPLPILTLAYWFWMTRIKFKGECEFLSLADARLVDERKGQVKNAQVGQGAMLGQTVSLPAEQSGAAETTQIQLVDNSILPRVTDTAQGSRRVSKAENLVDNLNQHDAELQSLKQENSMLTGKGQSRTVEAFLDTYGQPELFAERSIAPPTSSAMRGGQTKSEQVV